MINIRPISDLRNKFSEVESELKERRDEPIYFTKNGYGSAVLLTLEEYEKMLKKIDEEKYLEAKFGIKNFDKEMIKAEDEYQNPKLKKYTQDEIDKIAKEEIYGK